MSQQIFSNIDPTVTTGLMLASLLDDFKDALMSGLSGTSRPSALQAGGIWVDTSQQEAPNYIWSLKLFNGTTDLEIIRVGVLTGTSGFNFSEGNFTVRKVSDDSVAAIINLVKQRVSSGGQVNEDDVVAKIQIVGRADDSSNPIVAYIQATAEENMTASQKGVVWSFFSTPVGTNTVIEHIRFLSSQLETVTTHKIHSLIYGAESVVGTEDMVLTSDIILTEITGSDEVVIHGIEVQDTETKVKVISNITTQNMVVKHESTVADAEERAKLPGGVDLVIPPNGSASFFYSEADSRWKYETGAVAKVGSKSIEIVGGYTAWVSPISGAVRLTALPKLNPSTQGSSAATLNEFDKVYVWGDNTYGQLGLNDVASRSAPVMIDSVTKFKRIEMGPSTSFALSDKAQLFAWGRNNHGQLGDNTVVNKSTPTLIKSELTSIKIANDSSVFAIDFAGKAFVWGLNNSGQLGTGDLLSKSTPTAVLGSNRFLNIESHLDFSVGIKMDGTLLSWGNNSNGQLGNNNQLNFSSPIAVLGGHTFRKIVLGNKSSLGLRSDGVVLSWGKNTFGQLGLGDVNDRSSPVAVLGGMVFKDIFSIPTSTDTAFFGITTENELYSWGHNETGVLGLGDTTNRSSPVLVASGIEFDKMTQMSLGVPSAMALERGTGQLYSWGDNSQGQLGLGDTTNRSSPTLVSTPNGFSVVKALSGGAYGFTQYGIYAWGLNDKGQVGDGTSVNKSSPTLVPDIFNEIPYQTPKMITEQVVSGQTYLIRLGEGRASFNNKDLGNNIEKLIISYEG